MRRLLLLLSFIALLAVCVVGFLVVQRQNTLEPNVISQNFQRVIPNSSTVPNVNLPNLNGGTFDNGNDNVAQVPMTPPPAVPPANVQAQPYSAPEVDTIDASAPPASPPTPVDSVKPNTTDTKSSTDNAKSTTTDAAKPAPVDSDKYTFDKNGIFTLGKEMQKNGFHKGEPVAVVVDKGSHFTYVLQKQGDKIVIVYRASNATGASDTPSPPGPYKISEITKMPVWVPTKSIDPKQKPVQPYNKDHKNPLGVARIRLNKFDVALHGTNDPDSIRSNASHGCIRHSNNDIMKIVSMVEKGSTVVVTEKFVGTKLSKDMFDS